MRKQPGLDRASKLYFILGGEQWHPPDLAQVLTNQIGRPFIPGPSRSGDDRLDLDRLDVFFRCRPGWRLGSGVRTAKIRRCSPVASAASDV